MPFWVQKRYGKFSRTRLRPYRLNKYTYLVYFIRTRCGHYLSFDAKAAISDPLGVEARCNRHEENCRKIEVV